MNPLAILGRAPNARKRQEEDDPALDAHYDDDSVHEPESGGGGPLGDDEEVLGEVAPESGDVGDGPVPNLAGPEVEAAAQEMAPGPQRAAKLKRDDLRLISLDLIDPHPDNPRLEPNQATLDSIAEQLAATGRFDKRYAITVRPKKDGRYETIVGHTRVGSARKAKLTRIWAWVVEMSDEKALVQLATSNVQTGLAPVEVGLHSLKVAPAQGKKAMGLAVFAKEMGIDASTLSKLRHAAAVYTAVSTSGNVSRSCLLDRGLHLAAIAKAPAERWPELVAACVAENLSVREVEQRVRAEPGGTTTSAADEPVPAAPVASVSGDAVVADKVVLAEPAPARSAKPEAPEQAKLVTDKSVAAAAAASTTGATATAGPEASNSWVPPTSATNETAKLVAASANEGSNKSESSRSPSPTPPRSVSPSPSRQTPTAARRHARRTPGR